MDLFSYQEAKKQRDDALERVTKNANTDWKIRAEQAVLKLAGERETFIADDVWEFGIEKPKEPRALGGVMMGLSRRGVIIKTGQYRQSKLRHLTPMAVWRLADGL